LNQIDSFPRKQRAKYSKGILDSSGSLGVEHLFLLYRPKLEVKDTLRRSRTVSTSFSLSLFCLCRCGKRVVVWHNAQLKGMSIDATVPKVRP
jgi:hypothetical protein